MLEDARRLGFLGPGAVAGHIGHALGFAATALVGGRAPGGAEDAAEDGAGIRGLDLGSGGGVPGLVLARHWPGSRWTLLEGGTRRAAFLRQAVDRLALAPRVDVVASRAEEAGRRPDLRGVMGLVTARGFGPPPVVAECAAPFLAVGGALVVSEPPDGAQRWPPGGVARVGLGQATPVQAADARFVRLEQEAPCPARYPRRVGVPNKRPLF